jgi:NAD(P)H dehydrogenase (quinone)
MATPSAQSITSVENQPGKVYELGGDTSWSLPELAAEISRVAGRDVVYQNVPPEQYRELLIAAGLPPLVAAAALDTRRAIAEGELAGTSAALSGLIGRPTTPLADAVAAFLKK